MQSIFSRIFSYKYTFPITVLLYLFWIISQIWNRSESWILARIDLLAFCYKFDYINYIKPIINIDTIKITYVKPQLIKFSESPLFSLTSLSNYVILINHNLYPFLSLVLLTCFFLINARSWRKQLYTWFAFRSWNSLIVSRSMCRFSFNRDLEITLRQLGGAGAIEWCIVADACARRVAPANRETRFFAAGAWTTVEKRVK